MAGTRVAASLAALALLAGACGVGVPGERAEADEGPRVVTAFYPLTWAAEQVGGDDVLVSDLTPSGADAHDLELTSSQVLEVARADLILYLGGGFQPAVEESVADAAGEAVDLLAEVEDLPEGFEVEHDHNDEAGRDHSDEPDHEHNDEADPHIWLDPVRMAGITSLVAHHLTAVDPRRAADYARRARATVTRLEALHDEFRTGLAECERRDLVVSHEAFGYLADRYALNQVGIAGLDPEAEPSPQRVVEVVRFVEENEVTTIFYERQVSPRIAEVIADEVGVGTDVLDPLESPPPTRDYADAMLANLDALTRALGCR
jgi:zinc transport system substrate-binding protein